MRKGGAEDEPVSKERSIPEADKRAEPYDREAYKQSRYAKAIDTTLKLVEEFGRMYESEMPDEVRAMEKWANWMIQGGCRLSDHEIGEKIDELMGMSKEEEMEMIRRLTEKIRAEREDKGETGSG